MGQKYEPTLQWDSYMNDNECMFEGRQKGMGRVAFLIFTKIIVTWVKRGGREEQKSEVGKSKHSQQLLVRAELLDWEASI